MRKKLRFAAALVLTAALLCASAFAQEDTAAREVTGKCQVSVNVGSAEKITDKKEGTAWFPKKGEGEMRLAFPDGTRYVEIGWFYGPKNYTVTEYDAQKQEIAKHTQDTDEFPCHRMLYTLQDGAKYLTVQFSQEKQGISAIRAYTQGTLPPDVIQWKGRPEKCDMMVFSTHVDDEWLWFGGLIPYYQLVKEKNVQVVYVSGCGRMRNGEALSANAVAGMTNYPLFLGLSDADFNAYRKREPGSEEPDKLTEVLVKTVRCYKPEVIVTQDWNGEYGHVKHKALSRIMDDVIALAADPEKYPESAQEFGAWQVKKFYRHSWKEQVLQFDWHVPYEQLGGRTGLEVATQAMEQNVSQIKKYQVKDGGKYDNSLFGLCFSTVGDDVMHDDMFENIPAALTETVPQETEEPESETETETEQPVFTDETEPTEEPTPEGTETSEKRGGTLAWLIPGAIVLLGGGAAGWVKMRPKKRSKKRGKHKKKK